jgi:hypothetical protein
MKPFAVKDTDRRTERAALVRSESRRSEFPRQRPALNYRLRASQAFAENDAKDSINDSYAITWGILKPNIYHKAHNFAQGPIRPELSRQKPRRLLSAGRPEMRTNTSAFQSAPGWTRRRTCAVWSGLPRLAFGLNMPGSRMVEGGSCED